MSTKIQNRFRSLSLEAIALLILIPLSIFLFTKISNHQQQESVAPLQSPSPTATDPQAVSPFTSIPSSPQQPKVFTSIALKITSPKKSFSYKIPTNKSLSVIDAMKIAEKQGMTVKTKDYGAPLGLLVEAINDIKNDSKKQLYWTLYVNDKMSSTGASSTIVDPGETITWKFETTSL